ncbi:SpoIIE family protein phosphatase [Streptomyces sp. NPDC050625]|uniref:SpoIIE family protein phosphatase n=1 Tax=Streptomyces sp. NPDC050625 TaxID=3154629 RepID=UPI003433E9C4
MAQDTREYEAVAAGRPSAARSPRDAVLASALLELKQRLDGMTYAAYFPSADHTALGVAMALDTPCSFTLPTEMKLADLRQPTVRAYRTGEMVVAHSDEHRSLIRQIPALFLHAPFPMVVASVPLSAGGRTFGCLNVRWSRSRTTDKSLDPSDVQTVQRIARKLAEQLLELAEAGHSIDAPPIPKFIRPTITHTIDQAPPSQDEDTVVSGTTFLFQLKRLSTRLAGAVEVRDVLATAQTYVMEPLGAEALMLCRIREERLSVVGSVRFSRDEVDRVEGMPLAHSTPETESITRVEAGLHELAEGPDGTGVGRATPHSDQGRKAYIPLIASGRPIGCCVMKFPPSGYHLPADEEIALAALMLGQIGQTLERVYAHEVERVVARSIQQDLLPRILPLRPEAAVTSRYVPTTEGASVGGDWYDAIPLPDGGIGLVIGDVEGHNVQAATMMGHLRSAVLAYATEGHEPAAVLERIDALLQLLGAARYATCCCLWFDPVTGVAKVATAGHPLPLISPAPGQLKEVAVPVGPPLGLGRTHRYEQRTFTLLTGCVTALFTDGLLDTRTLDPDEAVARIAAMLAGGDRQNLDMIADQLLNDRLTGATLDDDVALLLMRYDGRRSDEEQDVARLSVQRQDLKAVASVRHELEGLLARWKLEPLLDDMQIVLSEAVTNGLVHAQSDVDIRLRRHGRGIRVEVQDNSPQPPVPRVIVSDDAMNAEAESGRGLLIVDALAAAWGSTPAGWGKTIWMELEMPQTG